MEEKLDYRLTYLTETIEDMKREMVRIRMILDLLEISSATLKKWRDQKLIGYSAVGNTYYYTDEDIENFFRNNHKKSVFETGMDY